MEPAEGVHQMPGVLFREIHKNGCLKKYSSERRTGFPRRTDRVWAVFCVHDDTEAFLEFYQDHKVALSHKPDWFVSLHNALHISPSICGQADEFEFAVTLPTQVVRLAAASWDAMMEWVDIIRNKLRELRVLAPKENVYSKMPEPKHVLLPTRDPTSPLPLPPVGALGLVPGVESPLRPMLTPSEPAEAEEAESSPLQNQRRIEVNSLEPRNDQLLDNEPLSSIGSESERSRIEITSVPSSSRVNVVPRRQLPSPPSGSSIIELNPAENSSVHLETQHEGNRRTRNVISQQPPGSSVVVINSNSSQSAVGTAVVEEPSTNSNGQIHVNNSSSNVTVIEVPPLISPHYEHLFSLDNTPETRPKLELVNFSGIIPRVPSRARDAREVEPRAANSDPSARAKVRQAIKSPESGGSRDAGHSSREGESSRNKNPLQMSVVKVVPGEAVSVVSVDVAGSSKSISQDSATNDAVPPLPAAFQPPPSGLDVRDIPLIGGHQRRRRRSSSSDVAPVQRGLGGADLIRLASAEAPEVPARAPRLTLRETQVCQLQREISHPGGVRLPLRRKDCHGAIALVEISNAVWVAGWKQREHPMLYNALHIGDRLISVGDLPVRTSAEAQKLLRGPAGPTVELVVRRLPLGKVLALQRPRGNGDVGLVPDLTNAGEVTVSPGGAASRGGLPSLTTTLDGLGLTTWSLTEVNGRPLNLFCKPADVTTRLNSVGKELSVLVQPSDFIRLMRKQLKNIKGYKDYLMQ